MNRIALLKNWIQLDTIHLALSQSGLSHNARIYVLNLILELCESQDFSWISLPLLSDWLFDYLCQIDLFQDAQVMRCVLDCISELTIHATKESKIKWGLKSIQCLLKHLDTLSNTPLKTNQIEKQDTFYYFKTFILKILGNMCFENDVIQNEIRKCNGIPLILNQCRIDDNHPCMCFINLFKM